MLRDHSFAIDVVYPDGNPMTLLTGLTAQDAVAHYDTLHATERHAFLGIYSEDDGELGWFDSVSLSDLIEDQGPGDPDVEEAERRYRDELRVGRDPRD